MTGKNLRLFILLYDAIAVAIAWILACLIRYQFSPFPLDPRAITQLTYFVVIIQAVVFYRYGLHRGLWRFTGISDLINIFKSAIVGVTLIALGLFMVNRMEGVPRTSLLLYPFFLSFFIGAPRLIYRAWMHEGRFLQDKKNNKRTIIIGAGSAGEMLIRDMQQRGSYQPVGILDDNNRYTGAKVHGIPVLGAIEDLKKIAIDHEIELAIIAVPSASNQQMQRIVKICEQADIPFQTLPRLQDIVSGKVTLGELKEVAIEDLLGRDQVSLDWNQIQSDIKGKRILVTGAGGSIGSELCRQIIQHQPEALVFFERNEFNLYMLDQSFEDTQEATKIYNILGDVCDRSAVEHVFETYKPQVIYHAAAYKHVPLLESQVRQAALNNIIGTQVVAEAADKYGAESFVLISTDKAVNPTNTMGACKRVAEIYCQNFNARSRTKFITVRFGNVLGSAGSVVPLFKKQIRDGGPVTVTHPEITRFFMSIPEACQLIMQAEAMGEGGEIFVLDMGEPIKITFLAEQLIRLSGYEPYKDVQIEYTGLRPGEKLHEELFHAKENLEATLNNKILLARYRSVDWDKVISTLASINKACQSFDEEQLGELISSLVPEIEKKPTTSNIINIADSTYGKSNN